MEKGDGGNSRPKGEKMKLLVTKTSDNDYIEYQNFNKVEELIEFAIQNQSDLVLGEFYNPNTKSYKWGVEIYDADRE